MGVLSDHAIEEIKALPPRYPEIRSAVPPALDLAQEELGHLTPEAMSEVARLLHLDPGYVEGVATFYTLLHLRPVGTHHFYVCTNLSCSLRGAEELCERLKRRIRVEGPGEVSADGLFSYDEVECLGACEYAPMLRFHHRYHYDMTPEKIDALLEAARRGDDLEPRDEVPELPTEAIAPAPAAVTEAARAGRRPRTRSKRDG